jgi:hypothetical protein
LDRPEASATPNGALQAIRIPLPNGAMPECVPGNSCSTTGNYYTIELREPRGWDRSFIQTAVYVHKVDSTNGKTQTYLMTSPSAQLTAGTTYQDTNLTVRVESIDANHGVASLTVTY